MRLAVAALAVVAACGGPPDPCADVAGACLVLHVSSPTPLRIDQLELDVLYDGRHGTTTTQPAGGGTVALPVDLGLAVALDRAAPVGVVAAGKLGGAVLATGAASTTVALDQPAALTLVLAPPEACVAGALYCGGDKLAGDPQTLYQCNGGGVPLARGTCLVRCEVRPAADDQCRGAGGCVDGGSYCGGDKLDGDPQTLYRCSGGVGVSPRVCPDGCLVRPGLDDVCR
ncbi:MAG: hypothetical protein R3B06_01480 [Kofleriaceae bacterium]